jgi:hypothetical protein
MALNRPRRPGQLHSTPCFAYCHLRPAPFPRPQRSASPSVRATRRAAPWDSARGYCRDRGLGLWAERERTSARLRAPAAP